MRTETSIINNMQQQHHHQDYMSHLCQDHLLPENRQQHGFTHLPSATTINNLAQQTCLPATTISLNEGLYTPPHLTSECSTQYYNDASRLNCSTSSCSTTSSISNSSNDSSSYPCSTSSSDSCNNNRNCAPSIGVNLRVTGQCSQGGRKYMEDYFSVAYQQSENAKDLEYAFIGIYDGHGGAEAAKFAKEHLMMEIINQRLFWSDNDHDVLRAIREGYISTHYAMWREQEKWPRTVNGLPSTAGTTATVAFIRREKIYIGHVGDSGIVLGYQNENENFWRAKQLTTDHKPESTEERSRIMNSGGKVIVKSGVPRVVWNRPKNTNHHGPIRKKTLVDEIPFLAVARSLGDLWSYNSQRNEFVVSPDPDVKVIPINANTFRCLIFGTDGLWNVVSAQEAVNMVRDKEIINERLQAQRGESPHEGKQWTNPSKSLVEQALKTWSYKKMRADNTSVVTVILHPPSKGDQNTNSTMSGQETDPLSNLPSFVQPISYGLEYTQIQAEVPAYDDATTYKEMALKYLPPEAYRNFDYYADESDTEEVETDGSDDEDQEMDDINSPVDLLRNTNNYQQQHLPTNNWNWQSTDVTTNNVAANIIEEDNNEEDENEDEEDMGEADEEAEDDSEEANEREICVINYQNYVHVEAEETNNATDSYINTFTDSYNSILTAAQDDCPSAATSTSSPNSSSSSSSFSGSNSNSDMQAILQEQQLYQQQCMSEEEGYSLTKLETRREQQTCKTPGNTHNTTEMTETVAATALQTFKIVHNNQQQQINMYHSTTDERFYQQHQHQQFMPQMQQKPLELDSLLQQEREEEQQVAFERLQMANKLAIVQQQQHQNITAYACLQAVRHEPTLLSVQPPMEAAITPPLAPTPVALVEENLKEEILYTAVEQDESVQINEISSSSSCGDDSQHLMAQEVEIHCESFVSPVLSNTSQIIEKIEKIEILQEDIFESAAEIEDEITKADSNVLSSRIKASICHLTPPPPPPLSSSTSLSSPTPLALTPLKSSLVGHNNKRSKSYLYPNVPNENLQRISQTNKHSIFSNTIRSGGVGGGRKSICMTGLHNTAPPTATSTPMIQRQLRSTTTPCAANTPMDYGKRTLRTRNSLSKDMKAKTSLVQASLKYPHNAVTRHFLRTTAASLLQGKAPAMLLNDTHLTACNRRSLNTTNSACSLNRSIKTRRDKDRSINGTGNLHNSQHHLNLRSRQTPPASPITANTILRTPTPVIKRASLTDSRSIRTIHTRSSASKGTQTSGNFSKSTRTQSAGSNLAAPPPSPKMLNAAAATRARSLMSAKHVSATNNTQSVVSAVFGRRTNLRSNRTNALGMCAKADTVGTAKPLIHQTLRGRIVKKLKR